MFTKRLPKKFVKIAALAVIITVLVVGQSAVSNAQGPTKMDRNDPNLVTLYTHDDDLALTNSDPQLAGSTISVRWVDNTFLGLTDLSPETAQAMVGEHPLDEVLAQPRIAEPPFFLDRKVGHLPHQLGGEQPDAGARRLRSRAAAVVIGREELHALHSAAR